MVESVSGGGSVSSMPVHEPVVLDAIDQLDITRIKTSWKEFDRVLGEGIVPGSVVLVAGEPGVGKSTLLLAISGILAKNGRSVLYYSGEESAAQIKLRASRLSIQSKHIHILTMASLEEIYAAVQSTATDILMIDSIQTLGSSGGPAVSGSVSSIRYNTARLIELGKDRNLPIIIVGHITKEGQIAGPKTLEHMVDTVLYFHGEVNTDLRILRVEKNRFGPVDEIGVFEMNSGGLSPVQDPSLMFLQHRKTSQAGIAIFAAKNGQRTILLEIQALVTESPYTGNPRRISVGFDPYRLSMLISVMEKKLKLPFYKSDVFINVVGGLNIKETASDLAVLGALLSSHKNISISPETILIGEIGLTGELRPVPFFENRIKDAYRQGFRKFFVPVTQKHIPGQSDCEIVALKDIFDFYTRLKSARKPPPP